MLHELTGDHDAGGTASDNAKVGLEPGSVGQVRRVDFHPVTSSRQEVSVIIPTLAVAERAAELYRAIESVLVQEGVRPVLIVVANGTRGDPALLARLRADSRIRLVERREAGIPGALLAGRMLVSTNWFGTLDDDDVLLPGALAARVEALLANPHATGVVSNGFRRSGAGDELHVTEPELVRADPLGRLLVANWLLPGSWLCRSADFGPGVFAEMPRFLECTYMAVRFAMTGRMLFLDQPGVVWRMGRAGSMSWSRPHRLGEADAMQGILKLPMPSRIRRGFRRKLGKACHAISETYLREGNRREAWRWHLRSLGKPGGYWFLWFTRHLFFRRSAR
jgi:glycosyltransferase involved in cell wall biosynthesis